MRDFEPLRARRLAAAGWVLAAAASLTAHATAVAAAGPVTLVDDRGEPLAAPVELCFVEGLGTDCVEHVPGSGPLDLRPFDLLRIEGPDHGPVTLRPRDLPAPEEGRRRLAVARKSTLRIQGASDHRLTAALYPRGDLDPVRPAHSLAVPAAGELKVPAGDWILALESRGVAPDLHGLEAPPGATRGVRFRARGGWSLVLRAVSKEDAEPVAGARVAVRPSESRAPRGTNEREDEQEPEAPLSAETGAAGLALISGLEVSVVGAEIRHPDFVATTLPGLSATFGTLELREVALGRGATLEAAIRVDGEPASGWRCTVLDRTPPNSGASREVGTMDAGDDGVCRGEKLPEGAFWLRVIAPEGEGAAERELRLYDGETESLALDLSPIRVEGEVLEGQEPGSGYTVRIFRLSESGATHMVEPVAEALTGEDGAYEATVWDTGKHSFSLADPRGQSADSQHADVQPPVTRVDFHLAPGEIEGLVVDEEGQPVAGAMVMVRWDVGASSSGRGLQVEEDGTFRLAREAEAGQLQVTASHPGYRPATAELTLAEDAVPPPIVLILRRGGPLRGRVITAGGASASGVLVMSFGRAPGGLVTRGSARTDSEGSFEVTPAERPPTRLYATGPECPLMAADIPAEEQPPVVLACPGASASLQIRFVDQAGQPVSGLSVRLRRGDLMFPSVVIAGHLSYLGQADRSDGSGRLVIPGLPAGAFDVHLGGYSSEALAPRSFPRGPLASVSLSPGEVRRLEVVVETDR